MTVYIAPELGATENNRMGVKRQPFPRAISAFKMAVKRMSLVYNYEKKDENFPLCTSTNLILSGLNLPQD